MNNSKIFSNAVAIADERGLLGKEQLSRLAAAEYDDALKMLRDYGYADCGDSADIDLFFGRQTRALAAYVEEYCPDKYLKKIIFNRYLYVNAKAVYKNNITGGEYGIYDFVPSDEKTLRENKYIAEAYDKLNAEGNVSARKIDIVLTAAMYKDNLDCASKSYEKILSEYVKSEIDLKNALTVLRVVALEKNWDYAAEMLVKGGNIPFNVLKEGFERGVSAWENTFLAEVLDRDITGNEAAADEYLIGVALKKRMEMTSVSPFFGYYLKKSAELKTVKMILTCIKNGVREEIRKRLRCYYE